MMRHQLWSLDCEGGRWFALANAAGVMARTRHNQVFMTRSRKLAKIAQHYLDHPSKHDRCEEMLALFGPVK